MMLHPSILALCFSSLLISLMTLYAAGYGIVILRRWDIGSGSELQLSLERRTYLISTIVSYFLAFQLVSLFLFIHTADSICHLFVGAMCAVGTLTANSFGYPTLALKLVTFILAGLWLILNHVDNLGYDYPLIRSKYLLLLIAAPFVLAESVLQVIYFLKLNPDIITSCCGALFSKGDRTLASEVVALPSAPMKIAFYGSMLATLAAGAWFRLRGTGACLFGALSGVSFPVALAALVSFISLYIYEMPSHHCPFCLLQAEYGYVGYPLYALLLAATVTGVGVGLLHPFRHRASLATALPSVQRKLAALSLLCYLLFTLLASWKIAFSSFSLEGY